MKGLIIAFVVIFILATQVYWLKKALSFLELYWRYKG